MNDLDLAGHVSARICHDLASPIGAIVNGADLIGELGPGDGAEELELVAQSARRAAAILKFHRLAFGSVGDPAARLSHRDLHGRITAALTGPRVSLDWAPGERGEISLPAARLACVMMLAARAALGRGGVLSLEPGPEAELPITVRGQGSQILLSDAQRRLMGGDLDQRVESREVEFALMTPLARRAGAIVRVAEDETSLTLEAVPA